MDDASALLKNLFDSQKLAVLATEKDGQPYASLMAFDVDESLSRFILITEKTTRKYSYLMTNPKVAMLIDSRPEDLSRVSDVTSVTVTGAAEEVEGPERQDCLHRFLKKHPYMKEFAESTSCAVIRVRVDKYVLVGGLRKVREYRTPL